MFIPEVRVVVIPRNDFAPLFRPSDDDLESGIILSLERSLIEYRAGGFEVRACRHVQPHHPRPNGLERVWWLNRDSGGAVCQWTDDTETELLENPEIYEEMEFRLQVIRKEHPLARLSGYMGFVKPGNEFDGDLAYPTGMQSQYRMHTHVNLPIGQEDIEKGRWIRWGGKQLKADIFDLRGLELFMGAAAAESVRAFDEQLREFGQVHIWDQRFRLREVISTQRGKLVPHGEEETIREDQGVVQRAMLPCATLAEAYKTAYLIRQRVSLDWHDHVVSLLSKTVRIMGVNFPVKQSQVPCMTVLMPNETDKKMMGLSDGVKAVVMPFNLTNTQSMLDTVLLARK